jgi:hypothetical protein
MTLASIQKNCLVYDIYCHCSNDLRNVLYIKMGDELCIIYLNLSFFYFFIEVCMNNSIYFFKNFLGIPIILHCRNRILITGSNEGF